MLSLAVSPIWLEISRRLNRIALLGITSPRETVRLVFSELSATRRFRGGMRAQDRMVEMATGATRWMGEIMPRSRSGSGPGPSSGRGPRDDVMPR